MRRFLAVAVAFILIGLGTGTYIRNQAWADEKTLWEDTLAKAPKSIRAYHELAYQFYEKNGYYNVALALYHRGLEFNGQNIYDRTLSLNNIASIHFTRGEYGLAEEFWMKAIALYPDYKQAYYRLGLTQTRLGKWKEAADTLSNILSENYVDEGCFRLKGIILLHENKPDKSIDYFRKAMNLESRQLAEFDVFRVGTHHERAPGKRVSISDAWQRPSATKSLCFSYGLPKTVLLSGRDFDVKTHLDHLIALVGARNVEDYFNRLIRQFSYMESPLNNMRPLLAERLQKIADDIGHTSRLLRVSPAVLTKVSESEMSIPIDNDDGSLSN